MTTIKVANATGPALDWLVAKALGELEAEVLVGKATTKAVIVDDGGGPFSFRIGEYFRPSTDWSQAGPIIERERIEVREGNPLYFPQGNEYGDHYESLWLSGKQHGRTPLIAAMRCLVASKLGDTVEVPEELL